MNEFNECVHEVFSAAGDICANDLFLKRTPTSDRLFACFKTIIDNALDIIKKELDNSEISVEYIEAYKGFGKHKK